ncbi:hypothetical protein ABIA25_005087 [Sinorhizobium fredii]
MRKESRQREAQQHDGEHRGAGGIVLRADDGKENLGRKHAVAAAKHERIAEVGHALDEADEECIGKPWLHERQRDMPEGTPAIGFKRLRSLLHRRADPLDDADQHQEGDRRERKNLSDPDAGQTIEPTAGLDAEHCGNRLGDNAGAAEQQRQSQADNEGRRDDRQHRQQPKALLETEAGTGRDQREGKPQQGRAARGHHRKPEGAPGNAAAAGADQAIKAPNRRVDDVAAEALWIEGSVEILKGADHHAADRIEDENGDEEDEDRDCADDEGVALQSAALGKAEGEDEDEKQRGEHCARTHGKLPVRKRTEERLAHRPGPAGEANCEALQGEKAYTGSAGIGEQAATTHRILRDACGRRKDQQQHRNDQPPPTVGRDLEEAGRHGRIAWKVREPPEAEKAAVDPVPGERDEGREPQRQGDIESAIAMFPQGCCPGATY